MYGLGLHGHSYADFDMAMTRSTNAQPQRVCMECMQQTYSVCTHINMLTYRHTYMHTYMRVCRYAHRHNRSPSFLTLPASVPSFLPACLPYFLAAYSHTYIHICSKMPTLCYHLCSYCRFLIFSTHDEAVPYLKVVRNLSGRCVNSMFQVHAVAANASGLG